MKKIFVAVLVALSISLPCLAADETSFVYLGKERITDGPADVYLKYIHFYCIDGYKYFYFKGRLVQMFERSWKYGVGMTPAMCEGQMAVDESCEK